MNIDFHRWLLRFSNRAYQLLLAAYPSAFRHHYGQPMAQVFRDCCRDAYQQGGSTKVIALWLFSLYDLAANALGEHMATLACTLTDKIMMDALLSGKQVQAKFMISSQQFPDARMFRLLDCSCTGQ